MFTKNEYTHAQGHICVYVIVKSTFVSVFTIKRPTGGEHREPQAS